MRIALIWAAKISLELPFYPARKVSEPHANAVRSKHHEVIDMTTKEKETEKQACFKAEPQEQHKFLLKLVGNWTIEGECQMGPDDAPSKSTGHETVRALGDLWMIAEGEMKSPEGSGFTMMTLGYDPKKKHFVGNWVGSMMTNMWVYEGDLDAAGKVLTLNTIGPDFVNEGKECKYQDIIEIVSDDHRILRSQVQGADGKWTPIMKADYRRKK